MQRTVYVISFICLLISSTIASGNKDGNQVSRKCGTVMPSQQWIQDFQQQVQQFSQHHNAQNRENASYNLPVIVHVIYWNAVENISLAQINSQIDILNADYAGTGFNVNNCPAVFRPLISNTNISFCKAAKSPGGVTLAEPGIERINAQTAGFTNPGTNGWIDTYIDNTIKPATSWDATKYLNIWVLPLENGTLGYATFPGGPSNEDGVVIGYTYYGNTGTVSAPYNKGRTTTHEIGHWLGLFHISGDEECGDDSCNDTPPQRGNAGDGQGLNYGCPTFPHQPNTCTGTGANGELFMNFMDYTDDACMFLFTPDQRTRMQTVMSNNALRVSLASSNTCSTTPQAPVANFSASRTAACPGSTVTFTDLSTNNPTSWSWSFPGGTPSSSTSRNPTVTYSNAGTFNVSLTATNTLGSDGETKNAYISVANPTGSVLPFTEGFQNATFPPTGWTLNSTSTFNWERSTNRGGFGTSTASMLFDNYNDNANGNKDDIITPVINLNGANTPRLKFDIAYAPFLRDNGTSKYDTLEILITDYCANTTASIYKKGGTQLLTAPSTSSVFLPTSGQWRKDSVFIPGAYLNKNVKITFRNYGLFANNIYVDNINLYGITSSVPTATANFTASDTTVCAGSSLTFTNTSTATSGSPDSVRWTIPGGTPSTSTSTTTVAPTFNTVGTYIISLKAYKSGNASVAFTKSIRVKAKPVVTVTSPVICSGNTAQPIASGASSYSWSGGLSAISNPVTPVLTVTTTYTVTGSAANCSNSAIAIVTVKPKPGTPSITQSRDTLYSNVIIAGASYEWYKGGILQSTTSTPYYKFPSSGTYTVKVINNGCSSILSSNFNAVLTGIKNNKLNVELSILPNPNNGSFEISISSVVNKTYQLKLYNLSGRILLEEEMIIRTGKNSKFIQLTGIEKGVYFLSIIGDDGITTQNIIVQ